MFIGVLNGLWLVPLSFFCSPQDCPMGQYDLGKRWAVPHYRTHIVLSAMICYGEREERGEREKWKPAGHAHA